MLDKTLAKKLNPLVNHPQWEGFQEYLKSQQALIVKELVVAQSEQAMYRLQGKMNLLDSLESLPEKIKEALTRGEQ